MKKFLASVQIGIADGLEYRFQLLYWLTINMVPIILMIALWSAIYAEKTIFGQYTLPMMITYYVITKLFNRLTTTYSEERIAKDIKDGNLSQFLTRPINYAVLKFGERMGIRIVNAALYIPAYGLVFYLLRNTIVAPASAGALGVITIILAINIFSHFLLARILGSAAFFMLETRALFGLKENIITLISGYMFPLFLFPELLQKFLMLTPFPYYYYFPMQVYFGLLSKTEILQGIAIQTFWMFALFFIGEAVWKKGLKKYEAVGA
ncbi:MAG: ABC-2 family transporter protein [Patescibacteria group bacterium]